MPCNNLVRFINNSFVNNMRMKITFRMDDITPTMHWANFESFVNLFNKYQLRPLLGIVPDNQDSKLNILPIHVDFWEKMRAFKAQGWSIAQHGYQHTYLTKNGGMLNLNAKSEFAGLSFIEQHQRILLGKQILERQGLATNIWMAPGHSYDINTLKALQELGFSYVTDGQSWRSYHQAGLKFIPCQMEQPRRLPFAMITVCIHANTASQNYINRLDSFVQRYRSICINFCDMLIIPSVDFWLNKGSEKIILSLRKLKKSFL
jgi:predicted deacetylase